MPGPEQSTGADDPGAAPRGLSEAAETSATLAAGPVTVRVGDVTITVQQPTAPPSLSGPAPEEASERGLFGGGREDDETEPNAFHQVRKSLAAALETLGAKIEEFAKDVASLEVRTYVSEQIEDVRYDEALGLQNVKQRALTHIDFDGDTQVVVPVDAGQIDEALWKIHLQTVEQAQAHRQAMLKTVGDLVAGFVPTIK